MNRILVAHTPLGEDWWAVGLQGNESLSSLYEFRLELKSKNPDIDIQAMIGETCAVECKTDLLSSIRYFSGLVIAAMAKGKSGKYWLYELTIAPKLWFASRRADFKIFQNLTAQGIADDVLQRNAILNVEWRLNNSYKTWEYIVQYGETDLAFLLRLLGNEGIYFWFEHGQDGEKLILGDHFNVHEPFAGYETIPYYPPDASYVDEDHFNAWSANRVAEPGKFVQASYDFMHPSENLKAESSDPRGHLFDQYEIFSYSGAFTASEQSQ
jgi:type VI secretion system secreted protein VgrG